MMTKLSAIVIAMVLGVLSVPADSASADERLPRPYRIIWDDFRDGFQTSGPGARWFNVQVGPYVADDGVVSTSGNRLRVVSSGTNPQSGEPAFMRTLGQDPDNGTGLPGSFDHLKWLAFTNHTAASGFPGFDAVPGHELSCETWLSGRTYGTDDHPFGDAVDDPDEDLRLALSAMAAVDPETGSVFDFVLTNERIYALYERRPDVRDELGYYASFAHVIPLADRSPSDRHHFEIAYDRAAGVVRWLIEGEEVFRVDQLGYRLEDRQWLAIDHGGIDTPVEPRQLNCGMGMFSLLDASLGGNEDALVRLTTSDDSAYFRPATGEPDPQSFIDDRSLETNRLFGQGAGLSMPRYVVSSQPVDP